MILSIAERHKHILDALKKEGFIRVIDVAKQLEVTTVTVRKDLKILEEKGCLYRFHGSASLTNPHITDRNVKEKEKENIAEKRAIGRLAAQMIQENDSIIMNSGSTVCAFAQEISPMGKLTVVTSSIEATSILSGKEAIDITQLGGTFRSSSMSVIGSYTLSFLQNIACSKLFLGVDGIDVEFGVTTSNVEEAELNRAMMEVSLKTIVLCDSSKFVKKGFGKICSLDKVDIIITDKGISPTMLKHIEELGVKVLIAD